MKKFVSVSVFSLVAAGVAYAAPAPTPAIIQKGKAPVVVLPKYLPSASERPASNSGEAIAIEKFVVTGSTLPKATPPVKMHFHR